MTRYFGCTAVAFVLVAGTGAASAQTVITREITTEPVETIIERGPTGTVITRRPLDTSVPGSPTRLQADTFVSEPVETIVEPRETTGVSATPAAVAAPARSMAVQRRVASPVPSQARTRTRNAARTTTVQRAAAPAPRTPARAASARAAQARSTLTRVAPIARPAGMACPRANWNANGPWCPAPFQGSAGRSCGNASSPSAWSPRRPCGKHSVPHPSWVSHPS